MARLGDTHVAIIGAGAAGLSAAIGLARLGVRVTLIEGARKPGAENWSGAVYFCENLARPEILGHELLAQTPLERRVQRRGLLICDGERAVGAALKSERAFRHVHTVLRPLFDQDLAAKAVMFGATLLADTTALALTRRGGQVTGVLTDRGAIDADLVFLAEGDASQLVAREGLELMAPGKDGMARPAFLQGIKEVLALPAHVIESRFGLAAGEGACFEILLRNGTVDGRPVPLNAGAFLYTNRESLSLGLVMPLENLAEFQAPHHRLMEWLKALPALQPLLAGTETLSYGAKLIRGGGHRQRPRLVMDGLVVGGAAGGFGVDFPAPNYTGPATYCGFALTVAVRQLRDGGAPFSAAALDASYGAMLRDSRYWKDEETLAGWPEFVASTRVFFDAQAAVIPAAVDALTRPNGSLRAARAAAESASGPGGFAALKKDALAAASALQARGGELLAALAALPSQCLNTVWLRRAAQPSHDERLIPLVWERTPQTRSLPAVLARRSARLSAGLAAALFELYRNDATPLRQKLISARAALLRRLTVLDLVALPWAWWRGKPDAPLPKALLAPDYLAAPVRMDMDARLGLLEYSGEHRTHIRFTAQRDATGVPDHAQSPLFTICPAHVYDRTTDPAGSGSVAVLHENCIRCESCWRSDDRHVDWGRSRGQRTEFAVSSPAAAWLEESLSAASLATSRGRDVPRQHAEQCRVGAAPAIGALRRRLSGFLAHLQTAPPVLTGRQQADLLQHAQALAEVVLAAADAGAQWPASDLRAIASALQAHASAGRYFQCEADALLLRDSVLAQECHGALAVDDVELDTACVRVRRGELAQVFGRTEMFAADDASEFSRASQAALLEVLRGHRDPAEAATRVLLRALSGLSPALGWLAAETVLARALADQAGLALAENELCGVPEGAWTHSDTAASGCVVSGTGFGITLPSQQLLCVAERLALTATPTAAGRAGALGLRAARPGVLAFDGAACKMTSAQTGLCARARALRDQLIVDVALCVAEVLEERAREHALSRVQFPGLFRDVRGRDGVAKFGAVRELLGGLAVACTTLRALARSTAHDSAARLALRLLGPGPRSAAYLAGQILGGTAYSEEDEVGRWFRDAAAFGRVAADLKQRAADESQQALSFTATSAFMPAGFARLGELARNMDAALSKAAQAVAAQSADARRGLIRDAGRLLEMHTAALALAEAHEWDAAAGRDGVVQRAALEWTLSHATRKANALCERASEASDLMDLGRETLSRGLDAAPSAGTYADLLADGSTFSSGDSARASTASATPELMAADPALWPRVAPRAEWTAKRTHAWRRALEHRHHLAHEDIAELRARGAFRMVIEEELGGLGLTKLAYYANCAVMARHGDISEAIVVMGSMSIGCLPMVIGLEEDLPTIEVALRSALRQSGELQGLLEAGSVDARRAAAQKLARDKSLRAVSGPLRKALEADVLDMAAGQVTLADYLRRVQEALDSVSARAAALRFFLRLLASGRISAFALTEPSAGSDTARVRTHATLVRVPAVADPRGFHRFTPEGGVGERTLFQREDFVFREAAIFWRDAQGQEHLVEWSDRGEAALPRRSVTLGGERIPIHDLGRAVPSATGFSYAYWRVQGAKMWITNASIAGVMVLYARTASGISAFALDGHAEGLVVGRDEHKLGQRGSTTNELVLNDVRISEDQIIGTEGRGQENALETLNVGRTGLAFIAGAEMQGLVDAVRACIGVESATPELLHALGRVSLDLLVTEALATRVTGRLDHEATRSIRMDSAAAKTLGTEALQRVLTRLEEALPREAVLESMAFEKRRRDSRVLSIYEGTNEVQRFLLARDVLDSFASESNSTVDPDLMQSVAELRTVAGALRKDAGLQPLGFMGADGFIAAAGAESLRTRAIAASACDSRWKNVLDNATRLVSADTARRMRVRFTEIQQATQELRLGMEPVLAHLGDEALLQQDHARDRALAERAAAPAHAPLRVALILDPQIELLPSAWATEERFTHGTRTLSAGDRQVLGLARMLRTQHGAEVALFAAGSVNGVPVLREALALAGDRAMLMEERGEGTLAASLAEAFAEALSFTTAAEEHAFDLVLAHESLAAVALPLATRMSLPVVEGVEELRAIVADQHWSFRVRGAAGSEGAAIEEPALLLCRGELTAAQMRFSIEDWRRAQALDVAVVPAPHPGLAASLHLAESTRGTDASLDSRESNQRTPAERVLALAGASAGSAAVAVVRELGPVALEREACIALVLANADGVPSSGASAAIAAAHEMHPNPLVVVLTGGSAESELASAVQSLAGLGATRCAAVLWPEFAAAGLNTQAAALRQLLATLRGDLCVDASLRNAVLLALPAGATVVDGVDALTRTAEEIHVRGERHGGRLRMQAQLRGQRSVFIIMARWRGKALAASEGVHRTRLSYPWPANSVSLDAALRRAAEAVGGDLTQAEFVIDVGAGVGGRDGLEEVVAPLQQALASCGVRGVCVGATRKVTLDLGILPSTHQIGQTGVRVAPRVLLALGVSGAPQHMGWIADSTVIFAFNKDAEAPLMQWNRTRAKPLVVPIHGDLFREVPRFIEALRSATAARS